jgi:hypothetical protein
VAWFAVTHIGRATEAGSGVCFVKFAAARAGKRAERDFDEMLDACESLALGTGAHQLRASVPVPHASPPFGVRSSADTALPPSVMSRKGIR